MTTTNIHEGRLAGIEKLMSDKELCDALGIGRTTLWRWRRIGAIPRATKYGPRRVGTPRSIYMAWLESHTSSSEAV